jgi:hypothetical protein
MSIDAPKPVALPEIDYSEHTLEMDTRWLFANKPELKRADSSAIDGSDLDDTQVNELLTAGTLRNA